MMMETAKYDPLIAAKIARTTPMGLIEALEAWFPDDFFVFVGDCSLCPFWYFFAEELPADSLTYDFDADDMLVREDRIEVEGIVYPLPAWMIDLQERWNTANVDTMGEAARLARMVLLD